MPLLNSANKDLSNLNNLGSATQVLTSNGAGAAPTFQAPTGNGYTLTWYAGSSAGGSGTPADSTTYYLRTNGIPTIGATASTIFTRLAIPKTGTIKAVYGIVEVLGTLSSGENATVAIRLNDTTTTNITTTVETNAIYNNFGAGNASIAVTAGDFIDVLFITPTWVTDPTTVRISATVYIE